MGGFGRGREGRPTGAIAVGKGGSLMLLCRSRKTNATPRHGYGPNQQQPSSCLEINIPQSSSLHAHNTYMPGRRENKPERDRRTFRMDSGRVSSLHGLVCPALPLRPPPRPPRRTHNFFYLFLLSRSRLTTHQPTTTTTTTSNISEPANAQSKEEEKNPPFLSAGEK